MAVGALEEHALAVEVELGVLDGYVAETVLRAEGHFFAALCIELHHVHGVEVGMLGAPQPDLVDRQFALHHTARRVLPVGAQGHLTVAFAHLAAIGGIEFHHKLLVGRLALAALHTEGGMQLGLLAVVGQLAGEVMVAYARARYII